MLTQITKYLLIDFAITNFFNKLQSNFSIISSENHLNYDDFVKKVRVLNKIYKEHGIEIVYLFDEKYTLKDAYKLYRASY